MSDRVYPEQGGRIGHVKLRGLQRSYIRRVRLIEKHGEFAKHGTGFRHRGDLDAFPEDYDRALPQDQQPAARRGGNKHGLAGLVGCDRKAGKLPLEYGHVGNEGHGHARCSVPRFHHVVSRVAASAAVGR